jgi:hypothetical protein
MRKVVRLEASRFRLTDQTPQLPQGLRDRLKPSGLRNPYRGDPCNRFALFRTQARPPDQNEVGRSTPERLKVSARPCRNAGQLRRRSRKITGWVDSNHPRASAGSEQ